ncbi:30S ribosomal protein S1 [Clostridium algidicarnis]|uniref:30S ribosomal protein S1 n=1 Tax=Clostridium algidicarnis TaxID=37659 RepID=UPI00162A61B0|nr:30S ribosomal protein S1 [Clostridium algidicarnis]MBB6698002.1 30S ribosomal protein S1 [Clostridium algidicarnis]MBU3194149.1 30S ribosomal protein S1 [Clostridium algidicarnis]MBU3203688.1 30S ribosomal protein S1 [Clostridium algidicarnis]MBU3211842.1 30S ribosomal protein S1 [Clostridium algidicarnis]MBU3221652.1 30S ribosomal protein S1 [Clostridium algidicarnis]
MEDNIKNEELKVEDVVKDEVTKENQKIESPEKVEAVDTKEEEITKDAYDFKKIQKDDLITGTVIKVNKEEVFVNINYMADGIIPKSEAIENVEEELDTLFKEGDKVNVLVMEINDGEGNVLLSKNKAEAIKVWDDFEESLKDSTLLQVMIKEEVKGGLIAYIKGVRLFLPASHVSIRHIDNLKDFIGKSLDVRVIELDRAKGNVVISRKVVELDEQNKKSEELWKELKIGEKRNGEVVRLARFGAFVDIGGIQGLVHISDLSWKRISDPQEVVSVGDEVQVYILDFDKEKNRVSLGLKDLEEDPWNTVNTKYKVNDIVEANISNIAKFGAFVEIEPGVEGLVPLGEIQEERVINASDILEKGQKVKVKILNMDVDAHRITLSIKEAIDDGIDYSSFNEKGDNITLADILGDKLKNFKIK